MRFKVVFITLSNWWEVIYGYCRLNEPNHLTAVGGGRASCPYTSKIEGRLLWQKKV